MAAAGTGFFTAGIWPLTLRRDSSTAASGISPSKYKLFVHASAVRTEKQPREVAPSVSDNGAVGKKLAAEMPPSSSRVGERGSETEDRRSTLRDYFEQSRELISRSDSGPPRWFSPLECGLRLKDSPLLLYLPGVDGVGMGLVKQHERLGKIFDIWCMHIPLTDRTSFTDLVKFVETAVKTEHMRVPNRPIYLLGESFGACLALAVAARNPNIDLALILANSATSYANSVSQNLLPLSELMPEQLSSSLPYLLTVLLALGNPTKMVTAAMGRNLPSDQVIKEISQDTTAMSSYLSVIPIYVT